MRHLWILAFPLLAVAEEFPVAPYTDPAELDCPWPRHSHYKQPWRGYIETKSGWDFLNGIGINLQIPSGTDELAIRLLAQAGFRNCRIEIGFGESAWDEKKLSSQEKFQRRFALCAKHGFRPTILINAHHGIPCPVRIEKKRLTAPAPAGTKTLVLDDVVGLEAGRSGLSQLTGYWAAEALITTIDFDKREVTLSKKLPRDIPAGDLSIVSLKYPPLHPVGTPEFDETAAGWVAHTLRVCRLARDAGIVDFDVEIWNELTFGTHYLNINEYYAPDAPKFPAPQPDPLKAGGRCWELARRTAEAVKFEFPRARCLWGFSNTTFFHTAIDKLPPGIDGQSYHPYGTGTRAFSGNGPRADQPSLEGFVPHYEVRMPEGIAHTFIQTESLMRLLNPLERLTRRPPGTTHFRHYLTEHGVLAEECGIRDEAEAWRLKTLCATRSFCLWLNKGIDVLHYFNAFEADARSFGLLPVNLRDLPSNARFEEVATPPLRAMANIVRAFQGSVFLEKTSPLRIEAIALGEQHKVFEGDGAHPPLWQREVVTVLPFQIDPNKHLLAVYVMTRDATKPLAEERYRLRVRGARGRKFSFHDPVLNKAIPTEAGKTTDDAVEVIVPVVDYPRLLTISRD